MKKSLFPHDEMRPSQREFYGAAASAIRRGKILLAHVPTGIGKTAAVLTAALENSKGRKILFLTARRSQHHVVIETAEAMARRSPDLGISCVSVIARKAMCINPDVSDASDHSDRCGELIETGRCPYYRELKDTDESLLEELSGMVMDVENLLAVGEDLGVCPYYLSLELARRADIVVADYNQIFSEGLRESFLNKLGTSLDGLILIVDEAHNLPDRIRQSLIFRPAWGLRALLKEGNNTPKGGVPEERVRRTAFEVLDRLTTMFPDKEEQIPFEEAKGPCRPVVFETGTGEEKEIPADVLSRSGGLFGERGGEMLASFSRFLSLWCDEKAPVVRYVGPRGPYIKSLDIRPFASPVFSAVSSAILMSGTLHPGRFYRDVLGIAGERARVKRFGWPFPMDNRRIFIVKETTTRYVERDEGMYRETARIISEAVSGIRGNAAAFFPSYEVLSEVERFLPAERMDARILFERRGMSGAALRRILSALKTDDNNLLLAVQSGSMAEGLDYSGPALSGVIVVGLPVPPPNPERLALQYLYSEMFGSSSGFRYAFLQPAVNRVLQSSGRLIRGEEEKGTIVLMDHRFSARRIRAMFPPDFRPEISTDIAGDCAEAFEEWERGETT